MSSAKGNKFGRIERIVLICTGGDCRRAGAKRLVKQARQCTRDAGLTRTTHIARTKCNGMCKYAPVVCLMPANVWLARATEATTRAAIVEYFASRAGGSVDTPASRGRVATLARATPPRLVIAEGREARDDRKTAAADCGDPLGPRSAD